MSRIQVSLLNLAQALAAPAPTPEAMVAIELAIAECNSQRRTAIPRALFDGQLLAVAEEIVPLLHRDIFLGVPQLAPRWHGAVKAISLWYEATQEEDDE